MKLKTLLLILITSFLAACGNQIEANMSEQMVDFEFITQENKGLSLEDLEGEWWIANLMYTDCRTICPRTITNLVDVQKELKESDLYPQIVSFSIDPTHDSPEVLRDYADEYNVDLETWDFLTGYDFETIQEISNKIFKATLEKGAAEQISHGYGFYLINPEGEIIKKYDGMSSKELNILIEDLKVTLSR